MGYTVILLISATYQVPLTLQAAINAVWVSRWRNHPKGPCTQSLGTWDLGTSHYSHSTGLGQVYDYWVLGPLGSVLGAQCRGLKSVGIQFYRV